MSLDSGIVETQLFAGEVLFREGETTYHFYILHEGTVEIFRTIPGQGKVTLAVVGPGQAVGEFAMVDQGARSASAIAITDVTASLISETAYKQLLSELPEWATVIMTSMVTRLRSMNSSVS